MAYRRGSDWVFNGPYQFSSGHGYRPTSRYASGMVRKIFGRTLDTTASPLGNSGLCNVDHIKAQTHTPSGRLTHTLSFDMYSSLNLATLGAIMNWQYGWNVLLR